MKIHAENPGAGSITWEMPKILSKRVEGRPEALREAVKNNLEQFLIMAACSIGATLYNLENIPETQARMEHLTKTLSGLVLIHNADTSPKPTRLT